MSTSLSASQLAALLVAAQHYLDATVWADDPSQAAIPTRPQIQARRRALERFLTERGAS